MCPAHAASPPDPPIQPRSIAVGDARITVVPDGRFRLDGGAMFGIVPRVVWEKRLPADTRHRVTLGLNAMVIEVGGVRALVDPGVGDHHDAQFADRFGVEHPPALPQSLAAAGFDPNSIDFVVNTHLHWDHAGAGVARREGGAIAPRFPNARYVVQRGEWEAATHPHDRNRGSYRPEDFRPVDAAGQLELVDGDVALAPGLRVVAVGGHSDGMQLLRVDAGGATFVFLADLVPTRHHLEYPWIMGYDLFPVDTLRRKQELLPVAAEQGWVVGLAHDAGTPFGRVRLERSRRRPVFEPL